MIYVIENDYLKAYISEMGATLTKLIDKKSQKDVVLGFETDQDYLNNSTTYVGASVGRNANRIGNAKFELNGKEYKISSILDGDKIIVKCEDRYYKSVEDFLIKAMFENKHTYIIDYEDYYRLEKI